MSMRTWTATKHYMAQCGPSAGTNVIVLSIMLFLSLIAYIALH